ncbi:hypothetical protein PRZ48_001544 [Zasmidium cellare]|uniref:Uncharacterized protein n=1 Tax=Zasmidium cellare TaxID=395010 RepID=A0ABR0F2J4_ZASCE|nr:hypothetical protein PRZ48_001544 [Zasmidium cellare]
MTALPTAPKNTYAPEARYHDTHERSERRKSRTPTVARPTSKKSNRRSWFGGRPDRDEDVPAVPRLVQHTKTRDDDVRPGTAITTNTIETQGRRHSIARSLSRKKSWFKAQEPQVTVEALPPMPVTVNQPKAATSTLPADQRRRRNSVKTIERRGSTASTVRPKVKKRSSFWASSNPDDSDSDIPPVPALIRDDSSSDDNQPTRKPRPLSTISTSSRKSYTPKSAAKGFLKSTNGASEEQRKSFRRSFHLEDESDLVCLTEEQRIEWAKLMNGQSKSEERADVPQTEERKGNRYSNAQALAALEFGVR